LSGAKNNSGNGGAITLETNFGNINIGNEDINTGNISSGTVSNEANSGKAGNITLKAPAGSITTRNIESQTGAGNGGAGNGGQITLEADNDIRIEGDINSSAVAKNNSENGGEITLETSFGNINIGSEDINTGNVSSGTVSNEANSDKAGNITLKAPAGSITTRNIKSEAGANNGSVGNGGQITLEADNDIRIEGDINSIAVAKNNSGNGGEITLETNFGNISIGNEDINTGNISSGTVSTEVNSGKAGNITLKAPVGSITTRNIKSEAGANNGSAGNGGQITLDAFGNIVTGELNSRSFNSVLGNGGDISLTSTAASISTGSILSSGSLNFGNFGNTFDSVGNRGNITLDAYDDLILSSPFIDAAGSGPAGNITLISKVGKVSLTDGLINSNAFGEASGGKIRIEGNSVSLTNMDLSATSSGIGNSGSIIINTPNPGSVVFQNSRVSTSLEPGARGQGGNVEITNAQSVSLVNSIIDTATFSQGNAGKVFIDAKDLLSLDRSAIFSVTDGPGDAGSVTVQTERDISLTNNSNISTAVSKEISSTLGLEATGNGNDILINNARSLFLTGGSQLQALTLGTGSNINELGKSGTGNSGNIRVNVKDSVIISGIGSDGVFSGMFTSSEEPNSGQGGNIEVTAPGKIFVSDGAVLSAQTFSKFNGGNINLQTNTLELKNGGQLLTNTFKQEEGGQAGKITVNATESIIISDTNPNFTGQFLPDKLSRNIIKLSQSENSKITVIFEREPNDSISQAQPLNDSFLISPSDNANLFIEFPTRIPHKSIGGTVTESAESDFYSFNVSTSGTRVILDVDGNFSLGDAQGNTNTLIRLYDEEGKLLAENDNALFSLGAQGSEQIDDNTNLSNDPYLRQVLTKPGSYFIEVAKSGDVNTSQPRSYLLNISLDTAKVTPSSVNSGSSSGIFARTEGTGTGGDIELDTTNLELINKAQISSESFLEQDNAGNAGNINVNASENLIARDSDITTTSAQSSGGAINIAGGVINTSTNEVKPANKIRLRGDSDIRTNVFSGAGGGGNINLAADSVIAFDDSDILAFARDGKGGDITFQTPAFFGESFRPVSSGIDPASLDGNSRVDVNASGAVDGLITLPNVDFITNSLQELPENTIDTDSLIASSCIVRSNQQQEGSFTVTGSGGLPTRPGDLSTSAFPNGQIRDIPGLSSGSVSNSSKPRPWKTGDPIVEPTGVYRLPNGELVISRECS